MTSCSDPIDIPSLLETGLVSRVDHVQELSSTQDRAFELARGKQCSSPTLVIADRQTAGRGRGRNAWWTGEGSLAFSLLLDPMDWDLPKELLPQRSLATAISIIDTLRPLLPGHAVGLHWPNDVVIGQRKIAGILIDVLPSGAHVFGIGLNVNNRVEHAPLDVRYRATTLFDLTGHPHSRTGLLCSLLTSLRTALQLAVSDPALLGQRFEEHCLQIGSPLVIDSGQTVLTGTCVGIAQDGALLLQSTDGIQRIYSGVIRHA
jgi:BirA family transcriptional regulator, biotin operon repressor / biotin---[acetyl-CoA-carboxylase] ligase